MDDLAEVDIAVPGDEAAIMDLCRLLHGENGVYPMDEAKVLEMIRRGLYGVQNLAQQGSAGIIGVIRGDDGAIWGCIYLLLHQPWYTTEWCLEELFNVVHPDHRRSNYAKSLIAFAKGCADRMERPLMIGVVSNERTAAKVRLYRRLLPEAGAFFLYGATTKRAAEAA